MADRWLEKELERQLAPVAAPGSLWDRIAGAGGERPARTQRRVPHACIYGAAAAAVFVAAMVGVVYRHRADTGEDRFAERELALAAKHRGFDFGGGSFDDARRFAKTQAGIDIDVPKHHPVAGSGPARVMGVRLVQVEGVPVAAIEYIVKGEKATLYVSGKRAGLKGDDMGPSLHLHSRQGLTYWNMRNETYTIAFTSTKNPHGACMLCHATAPAGGDLQPDATDAQPGL